MRLIDAFPTHTIDASDSLWRIHRRSKRPEFFGCTGNERFDPPPTLRSDYGVCYLADEPIGAYLEVLGAIRPLPLSEIHRRQLREMTPARALTLADLTDRSVVGDFNITGAISTANRYEESQDWSGKLFQAGYDGIRYRVKHDPSFIAAAVAMFGDPGEQPARFSQVKTSDIPPQVIDEAWQTYGLEVLPDAPLM